MHKSGKQGFKPQLTFNSYVTLLGTCFLTCNMTTITTATSYDYQLLGGRNEVYTTWACEMLL